MNLLINKKSIVLLFLILTFIMIFVYIQQYRKNNSSKILTNQANENVQNVTDNSSKSTQLLNYANKKLDNNDWTFEDYIISNLQIYAGEKNFESIYGQKTNEILEFTPILRKAESYLLHGDDENVKLRIQELLSKRKLSDKFLDNIIHQSENSFKFARPVEAQSTCEEGICYEPFEFTAGGFDNLLLIQTDLPNKSMIREFFRSAIADTMNKYSTLDLRLLRVVAHVNNTIDSDFDDTEAAAGPRTIGGEKVCHVEVLGPGVDLLATSTPERFKQTIAHEIFHCVQAENMATAYYIAHPRAADWWAEGGAEYFSNTVYPTVNAENSFNWIFDDESDETPIYRFQYAANIFFQHLGNTIGDPVIIDFMKSLPTTGGFEEQARKISEIDNIDEIFHDFGKKYLEGKIADTGGGYRPLHPRWTDREIITDPGDYPYSTIPFVIRRQQIDFQFNDQVFIIETTERGLEGKYSAKKDDENEWGSLPTRLGIQACGDEGTEHYKLLLTSIVPTLSEYEINLNIAVENQNTQTAGDVGITNPQTDRCLIGKWVVDEASGRAALDSILESMSSSTNVSDFNMEVDLCVTSGNVLFSTLTTSSIIDITDESGISRMESIMKNIARANYSADGTNIVTWNHVEQMSGQTKVTAPDGTTAVVPMVNPGQTNSSSISISYNCTGNSLRTQIPVSPYPEINMVRLDD